ncbi:hypothetical protein C8T65DRAFT_575770 [Cerioporus squamosus]|nr:hypothetical protein C8T65DRAFT_575770 [Cerioporus squamosus]
MLQLPFDIVHVLVDFSTVGDLVNFCSTCKALHHHLANDSLWRKLCAPYGLKDFTHLGGLPPLTIYSKLIHPYGPILGLWANDHPFRGNVMEFRLIAGDENEQGGIIGEVWSFATHVDRDPLPPSYIRTTKISFESVPNSEEPQEAGSYDDAADTDTPPEVRVFCCEDPSAFINTRHSATLYVRAESMTRHNLQFYHKTVDLPEFPGVAPWYDTTARLPRLSELPECQQDHSSIIRIYPAARLPIIWTGPSDIRKPPALSIRCLQNPERCPCAALHRPSLPLESLDDRPPRYYPLKRTILPSVDPRSPDWSLQTMEGLWYGSYGLNGIELLYLTLKKVESGDLLLAMKITGDVHVPRGRVSWALHALEEGSADALACRAQWSGSLSVEASTADDAVSSPARIMCGSGTLSAQGFKNIRSCSITGGMIDADELQIIWPHMLCTYRRYKGRDVEP